MSEIRFRPRWRPWTEYRFKFVSTACQPQYLLHLRRNKRRGEVTTDISRRRLSERRLNRRIVERPLNGILHKTTVALTPGRRPKRCKRGSIVIGRSLTLPIIRTVIELRPFLSRMNQWTRITHSRRFSPKAVKWLAPLSVNEQIATFVGKIIRRICCKCHSLAVHFRAS